MNHPNAFRPRGPIAHDLSRAPEAVRVAVDRPVARRVGEVPCRSTTMYAKAQTIPTARLYTETSPDQDGNEMVAMRVLDYRGVDVIAQLEIAKADFPTLLGRLIELYKTQGGTEEGLLEMYPKDSIHE